MIKNSVSTDNCFKIKLTDFGLSKWLMPDMKSFDSCGTISYIAPEILKSEGYRHEVDIWSIGCIFYKMICGNTPFIKAS